MAWSLAGCPLNDNYFIDTREVGPTGAGASVGASGASGASGGSGGGASGGSGASGGGVGPDASAGGGPGAGGAGGGAGARAADARSDAPLDAKSDVVDAQVPPVVELALNKSATASSEQTSSGGHLAPLGNDGSALTRWSASGPETPTWWRVDLGAPHRLLRIEIDWEFARTYGYLIEVSNDDVTYVTAVDRSASTDAAQNQSAPVNNSARYVRITVTAVTAIPISWASFWEVRVFGT